MIERARGMRRSVEAIAAMGVYLEFLGAVCAAPQRPVRARVHDTELHLRPSGPDLRVAVCSLCAEFGALPRLLAGREPEMIVDAGDFIGTAALALSRLFPRAVVLTLEPAPKNLAILSANVAHHPRVLPLGAALASTGAGPQHLFYPRHRRRAAAHVRPTAPAPGATASCRRVRPSDRCRRSASTRSPLSSSRGRCTF